MSIQTTIEINFDETINGYIVKLPAIVKLQALKNAKDEFENILSAHPQAKKFSLLLDTGVHEFESIECLKFVRTFLSLKPLLKNCNKFAAVAPANYLIAEIKSEKGASFNKYEEAYIWLKNV